MVFYLSVICYDVFYFVGWVIQFGFEKLWVIFFIAVPVQPHQGFTIAISGDGVGFYVEIRWHFHIEIKGDFINLSVHF